MGHDNQVRARILTYVSIKGGIGRSTNLRMREDLDLVVHVEDVTPEKPARSVTTAQGVFTWLAILAPRRVWQEEAGDALEVIAAMERAEYSAFKIRLKILSTIVWVLLNGLRELIAGLTGRKSPLK